MSGVALEAWLLILPPPVQAREASEAASLLTQQAEKLSASQGTQAKARLLHERLRHEQTSAEEQLQVACRSLDLLPVMLHCAATGCVNFMLLRVDMHT